MHWSWADLVWACASFSNIAHELFQVQGPLLLTFICNPLVYFVLYLLLLLLPLLLLLRRCRRRPNHHIRICFVFFQYFCVFIFRYESNQFKSWFCIQRPLTEYKNRGKDKATKQPLILSTFCYLFLKLFPSCCFFFFNWTFFFGLSDVLALTASRQRPDASSSVTWDRQQAASGANFWTNKKLLNC